jgi:hypothetical protein
MAIVLDGTANTVTPLNGALGATTPSTVVATTVTASTPIGVASGGTGAATLTSGAVLVGAGTSAISSVAPGTSGNLLTSNGSAWVSSTPAGGGVTSLNGQTGAITNTGLYAIGSYITGRPINNSAYAVDSTIAGSSLYAVSLPLTTNGTNFYIAYSAATVAPANNYTLINTGTWRCMSPCGTNGTQAASGLWVRIS